MDAKLRSNNVFSYLNICTFLAFKTENSVKLPLFVLAILTYAYVLYMKKDKLEKRNACL